MPECLISDMTEKKVADEEWHYNFACPKCGTKNSWRKYGPPFKKTHCISCRAAFAREDDKWVHSGSSN